MGTTLDLIVIDEKKLKRVNIAKMLLMPIFGITLLLKNKNFEEYTLLILTIIFSIVLVIIITLFATKTYEKTGKITVDEKEIIIEENSKTSNFGYDKVKTIELNFFADKKGFKLNKLAQIGKNEIKIVGRNNEEYLFHFLIQYDRTGKILYRLKKDLKHKNVKIENLYGIR